MIAIHKLSFYIINEKCLYIRNKIQKINLVIYLNWIFLIFQYKKSNLHHTNFWHSIYKIDNFHRKETFLFRDLIINRNHSLMNGFDLAKCHLDQSMLIDYTFEKQFFVTFCFSYRLLLTKRKKSC